MSEWKLFDGDTPHVSTFAFHEHRERAPHLEQWVHKPRLERAAVYITGPARDHAMQDGARVVYVSDLGCGDGGLLQLLKPWTTIIARGYDFQPSNVAGWAERGVTAESRNFVEDFDELPVADVYNMTEVIEHLADPHGMLRRIHAKGAQLVCSSPWTETYESHDGCHAWAWDFEGYAKLVTDAGFVVRGHEKVGMFQVLWATP